MNSYSVDCINQTMEVVSDITSAIGQNVRRSFRRCTRNVSRLTEAVNNFVDIEGLAKSFDKVYYRLPLTFEVVQFSL